MDFSGELCLISFREMVQVRHLNKPMPLKHFAENDNVHHH
jgi:hypothetical protein